MGQGRIQELARGGAQTGQVVDGWGELDSLISCCIFEAANNHLLVCLTVNFAILIFSGGYEVLKAPNVLNNSNMIIIISGA